MANKSEGLFADYMRERWTATNNPAAGTTCVAAASGVAGGTGLPANFLGAKERFIIESLIYSARNVTAAAVTLTASVRASSITGTVLASWDVIVGAGASVQDCFAQLNFPAPRGQDLVVEFGTPAASVTQKVAAAGWIERSQVD